MLDICLSICQAWNQACAQMAKANHKHYLVLLQRLRSVELSSITDRKKYISATTKDYFIVIRDSGSYSCNCPSFEYSRKEEDGRGFPCKHICIVASHAARYLYKKEYSHEK